MPKMKNAKQKMQYNLKQHSKIGEMCIRDRVPRVVVVGTILEHLEHIAPCAWLEYLALGRGVVQTGECAAGVQLRFIERRGNAPPVFGDLRKGNGRRGTAGKAVVPPALGGQLCGHKAQLAVRPAEGQGLSLIHISPETCRFVP